MSECKNECPWWCKVLSVVSFLGVIALLVLYFYKEYWIGSSLKVSLGKDSAAWAGAFANFIVAIVTGASVIVVLNNSRREREEYKTNLERMDLYARRDDVKDLIDRIEESILKITYEDEKGAQYKGEIAVEKMLDLYFGGLEIKYHLDIVKIRGFNKAFNLCHSLINQIYGEKDADKDYLHNYYSSRNYSGTVLAMVFVTSLLEGDMGLCRKIHNNLNLFHYSLPYMCSKIIMLNSSMSGDKGLNGYGGLPLLDKILKFDESLVERCSSLHTLKGIDIELFNKFAERVGIDFRIK